MFRLLLEWSDKYSNVGDLTQAKHKSAAFVVIVLLSLDLMVKGQCLYMFKKTVSSDSAKLLI